MLLTKLKEIFPLFFQDFRVKPFCPKEPFAYNNNPSTHSRKVFLSQQDGVTRDALLRHDPYFLVDPSNYYYTIPDNRGSQLGTPHIIKKDSITTPVVKGEWPNLSPALKSKDI